MTRRPVRLAVRGLLLIENRLLLVNAWPGNQSELWCAPGGGVEPGQSLPDNLRREFLEETGLEVSVGAPCLVNEFHDPDGDFHQVDVYFRCSVVSGRLSKDHHDPEGVVNRYRLVTPAGLKRLQFKPDSLGQIAWSSDPDSAFYDPLEPIVR